ncbi:serine hydrolase domain-containing protein [Occultella gossypii]|uniref:Beta-lactamase family protein n=1 Tax=Occultella gossypii TaxID=2800820 RepID=A0ABS7SG75_9MICO|nr:serine hydrolase domain-containing protein [Occultella gossypii]MBZ2199145.1 beta-lactamase family protein [Occultella gossypii]
MSHRDTADRAAEALTTALAPIVEGGSPPGLTWGIDVDGERRVGALGRLDAEHSRATAADTIYRISSVTKPVTAVAALALVEDGTLALDAPVGDLLPELADPRVLRRPDGPLEETEPASRPITVEDLLSFQLGQGMDFRALGSPAPLDTAMAEAGVATGPPAPQQHLPADEWLAVLGGFPLRHQPGQRWLYNTGAEVLGVLIARATGTSLGAVLAERVLGPLGMRDTGFSVPAAASERFGACFWPPDPETGTVGVYDPPDGQWASPPVFEGGDAGLVSTVDDLLTFGAMLRDGGAIGRTRVLLPGSVAAMTTNRLTKAQIAAHGPSPDGSTGWGLGVGVTLAPTPSVVGSYGWDGGLGSAWRNDTARGLSAVLLTNEALSFPHPTAMIDAFWSVLAESVPLT